MELANELDIPVAQRDIKLYDIYNADEAFDTRTTACIIPIQSVNGRRIGDAIPGSMTRRIVDAWSAMVGVDIVRQHMIWENEPDIRTVEG